VGNQTDYFEKVGYKPKYCLGERVTGSWKNIPFVGTVGNDTLVSLEEGPRISVHLDLPICFEGQTKHIIVCKHKDIKRLPEWTEESSDISNSKKAVKKS
jgi:hypothetical protein